MQKQPVTRGMSDCCLRIFLTKETKVDSNYSGTGDRIIQKTK